MPLVLNVADSIVAQSNVRNANLTKLMDEVRAKAAFPLTPPPSKLAGATNTYAQAMLIDLWTMVAPEARENQWLQFFEGNREILQTASTVDDFLSKYEEQSQQSQTTHPGVFATMNTSDPSGGLGGRKRKRDGKSDGSNEEPADINKQGSSAWPRLTFVPP
ncbi:hypothetical protein M407DRAFT_229223 [Tulasnella calospora MUT 4182]|uniref:Uncharacterized protein n=1 Tax=Tulasnella calospora MUT 4182 TaxID=1051891 RepID=A0A0C3QNZ0_9AGAM|nr:hypothetical protein M407DRAFT_229223 [Tulasnella calospora MUT 4182]